MTKPAAVEVIEVDNTDQVKNGLLTTEFWLSLAPIIAAIGDFLRTPPKDVADAITRIAAIISIAVVALGYNHARGRTKAAASLARAAVANPSVSETIV